MGAQIGKRDGRLTCGLWLLGSAAWTNCARARAAGVGGKGMVFTLEELLRGCARNANAQS